MLRIPVNVKNSEKYQTYASRIVTKFKEYQNIHVFAFLLHLQLYLGILQIFLLAFPVEFLEIKSNLITWFCRLHAFHALLCFSVDQWFKFLSGIEHRNLTRRQITDFIHTTVTPHGRDGKDLHLTAPPVSYCSQTFNSAFYIQNLSIVCLSQDQIPWYSAGSVTVNSLASSAPFLEVIWNIL